MNMTSNKPYLLRAYHEWIVDNNLIPYLVAQANDPNAEIPLQFVQDGRIILNIAPTAVRNLLINNQHVQFQARFGGVVQQVIVPMASVMAIYARENGQGIVFPEEDPRTITEEMAPEPKLQSKPKFTLIKPTDKKTES